MTKFIDLDKEEPGQKSKEIQEKREKYVAGSYGKESFTTRHIKQGDGAIITDVDDNQFIDMSGGWGCLLVGHTPEPVVNAIQDQAEKYLHTDFAAIPYEPFVELSEKLAKLAPGETDKSVALFNSGAEAVENVVKIARAYTERSGVLVFENAFHGRTNMTMGMTHKANPYKHKFGPFPSEIYRMPYPTDYHKSIDIGNFEEKLKTYVHPETLATIVIEPIQGEGGFNVPQDGFLEYLRELADKYNILLAADEIQSGMGRTGKMFAIENYGVEPDLIATAKSLAAGMPLSGVIGKKEIMDDGPSSSIGGTYVGNPVACRAAIATINMIQEENILERAKEVGRKEKKRLRDMKQKYEIIGDVRGIGAMVGVELIKDRENREPAPEATSEIIETCKKNGVLYASAGIHHNVIRFLNSPMITDEQLEEALDILENAIKKVNQQM